MRNKIALTLGVVVLLAATALPASAQRRGGGRSGRVVTPVAPVYPAPYYRAPFFYRGPVYRTGFFYPSFGYYGPWSPYGYQTFGYPPVYRQDRVSSVRFQVTPREALVFIDGYAAGMVDDYDGVFQRLQVIPGRHEVTVYLRGYRSIREALYLSPGSSHTIRRDMTPLPAGAAEEQEPVPAGPPVESRGMPSSGRMTAQAPEPSGEGTLALRIQPGDANVVIDGELWQGPRRDRLSVQLPEGTHQLRVEKEGFQPFSVDVNVSQGETTSLNVSLNGR